MDRLVVMERPVAERPEARPHGHGRKDQEAGRETAGDPAPPGVREGHARSGFVQRDSPFPREAAGTAGAFPAGSRILETELEPELTT